MRLSTRLASLICCALVPAVSLAGPLPERFTLGRYVPADMWMYMHFVRNPERAWLDKEWQEVFDAFEASGIEPDVASFVLSIVGEEKQGEAQTTLDQWTNLLEAVGWQDLIHEEVAFAERLGKKTSEYLLLTRGKDGTADGNMKALVAILEQLAALSDQVNLTRTDRDGVSVWAMACCGTTKGDFPFNVELFRKDNVIGVATSSAVATNALELIAGKSKEGPIISTRRFTDAIGTVKPPEDGLIFFDARVLVRSLSQLMSTVAAEVEAGGGNGKKGSGLASVMKKAIGLCDVMDYGIVSVETDGRRELTHSVTRLQKGKQKCKLPSCWLDRRPFTRFDRHVPADATGFNLNGLVDFEALYELVFEFVRDELPGGAEHIAKWDGILSSIGFDPQRDLFGWWSGEMISVTLPPEVVTPMSGSDWVYMFRVKDGELANRKMNAAIDFVNNTLQGHGQSLMIGPASVNGGGFRQITHPMMMMFFRPVVGVKGDWLMIGSSADPINKCLAVAQGKAPSILSSKRFQREGLAPKGPVLSCSFKDTSNMGQELGTLAGMVGVFGGMATTPIPDDKPEGRRLKQLIQKLMGVATKLGPILQKIDFYSSEASTCTYDGELTIRTEKVVTYKAPDATEPNTAAVE